MLSLAGFGILYNFAPMISQIAFGEGYGTAGYYIRCLCIMNGIRFVATSFAGLFTAFKKQYYELLLNLMLVLSSFCVYMIAKN